MDNSAQPVHLSDGGINIRQLLSGERGIEFSLDLDFSKNNGVLFDDSLALDDSDDSDDCDDTLKTVEQSAEKMLLSSPEYHSFEQLASKMIDCDPKGDVKLLIIEEGDGPLVPLHAEVLIHYAVYYERCNIPFDTTLTMNKGQPLRIRMGVGGMIPGLEIGLSYVKGPTARFHLLLQPIMAWGLKGAPPRILPQPVLFVISLYDVQSVDAASRFFDLPSEEREKFETTIKTIQDIREEGKRHFKKRKYMKAIENYLRAISIFSQCRPENKKEEEEINDLSVKIYVNLAVCYYKINKPKNIIQMCENIDRCTNIDKHCKGLFYYGRAYELLGKTDEAIAYYKKALKLEPKNKEIGKILANFDEKYKESALNEKVMWSKALCNAPVVEEKKLYDVDEDFKNGVADMCQDLAGRNEFAKFDLPIGLSKDEIICIKDLTSKFKGLELLEDGDGKRKKFSVIKKV